MNTSILSFNNGEVTPYLRHRIDFDKTASSAEEMRNFLPMPYGGVIKRPGLASVANLAASTANSKLLPFTASDGTKYLLHFTPDTLKIYSLAGTLKTTLSFMDSYEWPDPFTWENSIRDLHMVQVNDVAFFTHPGTFPLKLSRLTDTSWVLEFMPFTRPPLKDANSDPTRTFTVASNPVANAWVSGTSYAKDTKVFTNSEWICIAAHTASAANKPGSGTSWRTYWRQMLYAPGDAITILTDDKSAAPWMHINPQTFDAYTVITSNTANVWYMTGTSGLTIPTNLTAADWETTWLNANYTTNINLTTTSKTVEVTTPGWGGAGTIFYSTGQVVQYNGSIYLCLNDTGGTPLATLPGVTAGWTDYYTLLVENFSAVGRDWQVSYALGEEASNNGKVYECILAHEARPAREPGVGVDTATYWEEVGSMLPEFDMSDYAPGHFFMVAPNRPPEDFQVELAASANGTSGHIIVQGAWTFSTFGTWFGTWNLQRSVNNGASWETFRSWESKGDRNISATGTEDEPTLLRLTFVKSTGRPLNSPRGVLTPEKPDVKGYALMDTYVGADSMTGTALTSLMSGNTPKWAQGAFNPTDGYPRAVALHESRLVFAGTDAQPVSLWLSASDDLDNFETGTDADNGIAATLAASAATPIRWLASQRRLFVGTLMNEWVCGSESSDTPITPETFVARQHTAHGSNSMQPVLYASGLLFLTRKGTRLRDYGYSYQSDSYDALDLTRLAEHLATEGISSMAWQQSRESGLWAVRRDGALLHFAYSKADNIQAWSKHDTTGGTFLDVVTFPSDEGDDDVFFVVNRQAGTKLERFPQHWQAAYEAGEGYLCTDPSSTAITSILRSLPIDSGAGDGTTQGRRKRPHKFVLSLYQSAGGTLWNRNQNAAQTILADDADLLTGWVDIVPDPGHGDDCQLNIQHADPCPFILRSACIRWQLHERA